MERGQGVRMTGPDGQKRPQGDIEAAVKIARMAVEDPPEDGPGGPRGALAGMGRADGGRVASTATATQRGEDR